MNNLQKKGAKRPIGPSHMIRGAQWESRPVTGGPISAQESKAGFARFLPRCNFLLRLGCWSASTSVPEPERERERESTTGSNHMHTFCQPVPVQKAIQQDSQFNYKWSWSCMKRYWHIGIQTHTHAYIYSHGILPFVSTILQNRILLRNLSNPAYMSFIWVS